MMSITPTTLSLFADALIAPALLVDLSEVDELMVALSCRPAVGISPLLSKTGLTLKLLLWHTLPDATSGSEAGPRLGSQPTARVDVHPGRLPYMACGSLEVSPLA